ncbi:hypothetical protein OC834_001298, partial [Tilletia horrida]
MQARRRSETEALALSSAAHRLRRQWIPPPPAHPPPSHPLPALPPPSRSAVTTPSTPPPSTPTVYTDTFASTSTPTAILTVSILDSLSAMASSSSTTSEAPPSSRVLLTAATLAHPQATNNSTTAHDDTPVQPLAHLSNALIASEDTFRRTTSDALVARSRASSLLDSARTAAQRVQALEAQLQREREWMLSLIRVAERGEREARIAEEAKRQAQQVLVALRKVAVEQAQQQEAGGSSGSGGAGQVDPSQERTFPAQETQLYTHPSPRRQWTEPTMFNPRSHTQQTGLLTSWPQGSPAHSRDRTITPTSHSQHQHQHQQHQHHHQRQQHSIGLAELEALLRAERDRLASLSLSSPRMRSPPLPPTHSQRDEDQDGAPLSQLPAAPRAFLSPRSSSPTGHDIERLAAADHARRRAAGRERGPGSGTGGLYNTSAEPHRGSEGSMHCSISPVASPTFSMPFQQPRSHTTQSEPGIAASSASPSSRRNITASADMAAAEAAAGLGLDLTSASSTFPRADMEHFERERDSEPRSPPIHLSHKQAKASPAHAAPAPAAGPPQTPRSSPRSAQKYPISNSTTGTGTGTSTSTTARRPGTAVPTASSGTTSFGTTTTSTSSPSRPSSVSGAWWKGAPAPASSTPGAAPSSSPCSSTAAASSTAWPPSPFSSPERVKIGMGMVRTASESEWGSEPAAEEEEEEEEEEEKDCLEEKRLVGGEGGRRGAGQIDEVRQCGQDGV